MCDFLQARCVEFTCSDSDTYNLEILEKDSLPSRQTSNTNWVNYTLKASPSSLVAPL